MLTTYAVYMMLDLPSVSWTLGPYFIGTFESLDDAQSVANQYTQRINTLREYMERQGEPPFRNTAEEVAYLREIGLDEFSLEADEWLICDIEITRVGKRGES